MQKINQLFVVMLATLLAGCSYIYGDQGFIHNRSVEYTKAQSIPPLKIPPGLSSSSMEAHYPVSDADYPNSKTPVNLIPPELYAYNTTGK
jgi:uncharacterized lipoprotein